MVITQITLIALKTILLPRVNTFYMNLIVSTAICILRLQLIIIIISALQKDEFVDLCLVLNTLILKLYLMPKVLVTDRSRTLFSFYLTF